MKLHTTALEDWVTQFYTRLRIYHPKQIDIRYIARRLEIFLRVQAIEPHYQVIGRFRCIVVNSCSSAEEQREQFFHELCHILRHSGTQSMMPEAFRQLQEWDARHFVLYASIPFHMLKFIDYSSSNVIEQTSSLFQISERLCAERLQQIKERQLAYGFYCQRPVLT